MKVHSDKRSNRTPHTLGTILSQSIWRMLLLTHLTLSIHTNQKCKHIWTQDTCNIIRSLQVKNKLPLKFSTLGEWLTITTESQSLDSKMIEKKEFRLLTHKSLTTIKRKKINNFSMSLKDHLQLKRKFKWLKSLAAVIRSPNSKDKFLLKK